MSIYQDLPSKSKYEKHVNFDNTKAGYALHIRLSATDSAVDVTIK